MRAHLRSHKVDIQTFEDYVRLETVRCRARGDLSGVHKACAYVASAGIPLRVAQTWAGDALEKLAKEVDAEFAARAGGPLTPSILDELSERVMAAGP